MKIYRGACVAQSLKHPTLDFGSGHDLTVPGIEPHVGLCTNHRVCLGFSLLLSLPLLCSCTCALSLNK